VLAIVVYTFYSNIFDFFQLQKNVDQLKQESRLEVIIKSNNE